MGKERVEQMRETLIEWMQGVVIEMAEGTPELQGVALANLEENGLRRLGEEVTSNEI